MRLLFSREDIRTIVENINIGYTGLSQYEANTAPAKCTEIYANIYNIGKMNVTSFFKAKYIIYTPVPISDIIVTCETIIS
jgi:hypothetical protein